MYNNEFGLMFAVLVVLFNKAPNPRKNKTISNNADPKNEAKRNLKNCFIFMNFY